MASLKKVLFTVTNDLSYDQRMDRICTSLANNGYEVWLIGRKRKTSIPLNEKAFQQKRFNCYFDRGKLFYLEYNIRLFIFLLFTRFDIVCGIDLDTILPCYAVAKIKSKLCVHDSHEYFSEVPEVIERPTVQKIWRKIEGFAFRRIKTIYTVSESIAKIYKEEYDANVNVIRNVPILLESVNKKNGKEQYLLYQGALNKGRGLEAMIKAMKHIDMFFYIAGEGDLSEELRALAKTEGDDKIRFLGFVKPNELKSLTQSAFIGINLAENLGLSYYYSLNNKFFDYIHAEIPAITIGFPEYQLINNQYEVSVLLDDLDIDNLTRAVNKLISDKTYYEKLQANCRKAKQVFNWQKEEQTLLKIYHNLD